MSGELKMVTKKTTVTKAPAKKVPAKKTVVTKAPAKKVPAKTTVVKAAPKTKAKKVEDIIPAPLPKSKKKFASPKEEATFHKKPWVGVLETHVNSENPSNGFFELDWNEYFIVQLKGHGYDGPTEESIVDVWFQALCRNIGSEEGMDMERRGSGYININNLGNGKSEVS